MTLRAKTILGIALIEIVLLLLLIFSAMSFLADSNERQLIQRAHATASMFAHASTNALLATDLATLDDLGDQIMQLEDVLYLRIVKQDQVLVQKGENVLQNHTPVLDESLKTVTDGIFDTREYITFHGETYGYVDMGYSTAAIDTLLSQARQSIVSIASLEVLLVAIFSFFLGTYLTKNLVKLANAALTVSKKGPGYQLNLKQNDELGEVAHAFDQMSASLQQNYQELRQARVEAETANESKSRFLASMSHEIRTPMNGVLGLLSLLEETELNKEQKKLLATATESGQFLLSIINDILDFSRMEANTLSLERQPFELKSCIESVVNSFVPLAHEKQLLLECQYDPKLPPYVYGDANRYRQILLNLLGNAFKFTEQGAISVEVSIKPHDNEQQCRIECSVSDTGVGIEQEAQSYLFDEFTMVDQTYSRTNEGSGLGLAICKRLVYLMDGEISVSSQLGQGSQFTFHVILDTAPEPQIAREEETVIATEQLKQLKVLVAEDNKANQLVIRNLFLHAGIEIDLADNGLHALEQVKHNTYDIVFMDISMPEMDGMETCEKIRELDDPQKANLPIVALTAHALSGDKEHFLKVGMNGYLSKPVRKQQLLEMLTEQLGDKFNPNNELTLEAIEPITSDQTLETSTSLANTMSMNNLTSETPQLDEAISQPTTANQDEPQTPLVCPKIIEQMIEDTSKDVLPMLIEHYIEETYTRIQKITDAVGANDAEALEFETHTLGSSSLALGNQRLSESARHVERLCIEGEASQALELAKQLAALAQESVLALVQHNDQALGLTPIRPEVIQH
ncbi:response regulator [Vibrio sp. SCSIO 43136]|uniref:response regulator n=1 Tax=Vibrio sp. SCSIO 43136 TaxID=2819101 RepID=UPI00207603CB|nr:response regulator [Vibrio sp. SCSIO 43136]USD67799.1 response regulator [Vibrio sp. SCSIO 43136]